MILFAILLGILFAVWLTMLILWYDCSCGCTQITFKDFKKFYTLNPDRWELDDYGVKCNISKRDVLFGNTWDNEPFAFNFADCWKYKWWYRQIKKYNRNKSHMESTQRMLDAVKEDIKNTQTNTERSIEEYIRTVMEFAKNNGHDTTQLEDILRRVEKQNEKL